jgi:hypothetical protein
MLLMKNSLIMNFIARNLCFGKIKLQSRFIKTLGFYERQGIKSNFNARHLAKGYISASCCYISLLHIKNLGGILC